MTDDELDQRLRESILSEEIDTSRVATAVRDQIAARSHGTVPGWAVAAAAVIAMVLAATFSYRTFHEQQTPPLCAAAARDHQREIVNGEPRPWLTDLSAIQALAAKQGVPVSAIAALSTIGYRLERGRLCFLQKQIFLHLVYIKDGGQYSVYLRPRTPATSFTNSVRGTENLAYFQTGGVTAVFVSHATGADALAFARAGARVLATEPRA
jgi:hypothetical protein